MCRGGIVDRLDKGCWRWSYQAAGKENIEEVCTVDADGWCNTEGCWDEVRWRQMMILDHDCFAKFYTWSFKTMNINSEIHVWVMQVVSLSMTATSGREQLFSQKWSRQDPPPLLIVRGFHRSPGERQPVYKQSTRTECSRSQTDWHDLQIIVIQFINTHRLPNMERSIWASLCQQGELVCNTSLCNRRLGSTSWQLVLYWFLYESKVAKKVCNVLVNLLSYSTYITYLVSSPGSGWTLNLSS